MSNKIDVSNIGAIESCCGRIRSCNKELKTCLNEIRNGMKATREHWQGKAGETTRGNFEKTANMYFEAYEKQIERYATFLERAAMEYREAEERRKSGLV